MQLQAARGLLDSQLAETLLQVKSHAEAQAHKQRGKGTEIVLAITDSGIWLKGTKQQVLAALVSGRVLSLCFCDAYDVLSCCCLWHHASALECFTHSMLSYSNRSCCLAYAMHRLFSYVSIKTQEHVTLAKHCPEHASL